MESGNAFKIAKLKGSSNIEIWAIRMEAYLIEKGLGSTIKETPQATRASTTDADIEANNSIKVYALIRLSLEDGPLIQTKGLQTALEL